jgi:hypothetical protein
MTFEEFQNRARLFVIGALYPQEIEAFLRARREFGTKAEAFVRECYALHEAFALSMRPPSWRDRFERRLVSIARQRVNG